MTGAVAAIAEGGYVADLIRLELAQLGPGESVHLYRANDIRCATSGEEPFRVRDGR